MTTVGFAGFKCPKGNNDGLVPIPYCEDECKDRCHPLPLLLSLASSREVIPNVYSVTEIIRPYQQIHLQRNHAYYLDPMSMIWMALGSGVHSIFEEGAAKIKDSSKYVIECRKETYFADLGVTLRGTPDMVDYESNRIDDYKTVKAYPVKKLKSAGGSWTAEDYFIQVNIYRALWYPEIENLRLVCIVKDWSNQVLLREGIMPIEYINVPHGDLLNVYDFVEKRLARCVDMERGGEIPKCLTKDLWCDKNGNPSRCINYCSVNEVCPQFAKTEIFKSIHCQ